jgi:hypothetical protein
MKSLSTSKIPFAVVANRVIAQPRYVAASTR